MGSLFRDGGEIGLGSLSSGGGEIDDGLLGVSLDHGAEAGVASGFFALGVLAETVEDLVGLGRVALVAVSGELLRDVGA